MINTATADFYVTLTCRRPFFLRTVRVTYRSIRAIWRACGNLPDVRGGVRDLDGAALAPPVPGFLACDTPRDADGFSPRRDEFPHAPEPAQSARAAWSAVTPRLAGTPHVRISRDGGRTYPARHARLLPAEPPGQPCTVPVYDPAAGTGRMLALDLDPFPRPRCGRSRGSSCG
jgi:hypothetical protein